MGSPAQAGLAAVARTVAAASSSALFLIIAVWSLLSLLRHYCRHHGTAHPATTAVMAIPSVPFPLSISAVNQSPALRQALPRQPFRVFVELATAGVVCGEVSFARIETNGGHRRIHSFQGHEPLGDDFQLRV
jgi:hypothetical protein